MGGRGSGGGKETIESLRNEDVYGEVDRFHGDKDFVALEDDVNGDFEDGQEFEVDEELALEDEGDLDLEEEEDEQEMQGESEEEDVFGGEVEDRNISSAWGKKRSMYYDHDMGGFGDEKEEREEEAEVKRLRSEMLENIEEEDYNDDTLLMDIAKKIKQGAKFNSQVQPDSGLSTEELTGISSESALVERLEKDLKSLSDEDKLEYIALNFPEMFSIVEDYKRKLEMLIKHHDLMHKLQHMPCEIQLHQNISNSVDYFNLKYRTLLSYCLNVNAYFLLRASGSLSKDHSILNAILGFSRRFAQFEYFDKSFSNEINLLIEKLNSDPALPFEQEPVNTLSEVELELMEENECAPAPSDKDSESAPKSRKRRVKSNSTHDAEMLLRSEESALVNMHSARSDLPKTSNSNSQELDDFEELEDFMDSGTDRPFRESLVDLVRAKKNERKEIIKDDIEEDNQSQFDAEDSPRLFDDDDIFGGIQDSISSPSEKKKKKTSKVNNSQEVAGTFSESSKREPLWGEDPDFIEGRRPIGKKIMKNIGLKRYRKRDDKNPRKKLRNKYAKAITKRKSQVQEYKGSRDVYSGEVTGIKNNISRSTRL